MRVGYLLTHPIQYQSPMIRALVAGGVDLHVAYGCQASGGSHVDPGFGHEITWDTPLLEGYPFRDLQAERGDQSTGRSFRVTKERATRWLRDIGADVAWIHGWGNPFPKVPWFSIATLAAARGLRLPVMLRGETNDLCLRGGGLRRMAHSMFLRSLFTQVDRFLAVGTANRDFYLRRGVSERQIAMVPYAVDNDFFRKRCTAAAGDRESLRRAFGIPDGAPLLLFVGRLVEAKGCDTLLRAFGGLSGTDAHLLIVGEGTLRAEMEQQSARIAPGRVHFAGFRNQSELPKFYAACDCFVLPSVFEPWGLVVNEVMNAGKPVIVSDVVGAGPDLVRPGVNGEVFHAGDAEDLKTKLLPWLQNEALRESGGAESLRVIERWGFAQDLAGVKQALESLKTRSHA